MVFNISIKYDRKIIRLKVEKITQTETTEKYKVTAKNQSFVLQNDRPVIIAKGFKYFPITWRVTEGGYHQQYILDLIIKEVEKKIV